MKGEGCGDARKGRGGITAAAGANHAHVENRSVVALLAGVSAMPEARSLLVGGNLPVVVCVLADLKVMGTAAAPHAWHRACDGGLPRASRPRLICRGCGAIRCREGGTSAYHEADPGDSEEDRAVVAGGSIHVDASSGPAGLQRGREERQSSLTQLSGPRAESQESGVGNELLRQPRDRRGAASQHLEVVAGHAGQAHGDVADGVGAGEAVLAREADREVQGGLGLDPQVRILFRLVAGDDHLRLRGRAEGHRHFWQRLLEPLWARKRKGGIRVRYSGPEKQIPKSSACV